MPPQLVAADIAPPTEQALFAELKSSPPPAEPAWVAVLVVVLLLSALRVAGAIRDRAKESANGVGL
jgi:hypothetical protein